MLAPVTRRFALLLVSFALTFGCDDGTDMPDAATRDAGAPDVVVARCTEPTGTPTAIFALPRDGTEPFFDLPWPNDVRRTASGTVDMSAFPNPRNVFLQRYLDTMTERLEGFGTNGAVYFRFSHPIDAATLPATPEATVSDGASVFLIDVDPASPDLGSRHPAVLHYQECPTRYWSAHSVAIRPVYGIPLASSRRYAAVVTRGVMTEDGGAYERDADFEALLGTAGDGTVDAARAVYGDVFDVLEAAGVARTDLLSVTVFTTQDAIGETIGIRDWMVNDYETPTVDDASLEVVRESPRLTEITGTYGPVPVFQDGEIPFIDVGGAIDVDADGAPTVHSEYRARFTLTIPTTPMPAEGYPIVLYAHGTGGDHSTFVSNDVGANLARLGFAAMGIDQIHHGERNPTDTDPAILFFNIPNPLAARDNNRQSALDVVQQARLVPGLTFPTTVVDRGGEAIRFDATHLYFMGHSQGGLNGPIYLAIDDTARGAVLSAASAVITPSLLEKLEPLEIPAIVKGLLNLPGANWQDAYALEGFTVEHPIATLLQTWLEVSDGSNYAHLIFQAPRDGFAPKSVLMTEGLLDRYAPPASIEALAGSMRVPLVTPAHHPLESLSLLGIGSVSPPVTANVAGGMATAGLLQFPDDGHFAIFDNPVAEAQVFGFFESLAAGGPGTIPAP